MDKSSQQIHIFSKISPKSCRIGQNSTGTWGVNTVIAEGIHGVKFDFFNVLAFVYLNHRSLVTYLLG